MNFPKNLKFQEKRVKEKFREIEDLFANKAYEIVEQFLEDIKLEQTLFQDLNEEDLKTLEKIQYESLTLQNKFVEAFERLGHFKFVEQFHLKSQEKIYNNFIEEMKDREEDI